MTESSIVQYLIQGGAVGIALVSLWIIYKLISNHDAHFLNALERNTDAWQKNTEAITRLTDKLEEKKLI